MLSITLQPKQQNIYLFIGGGQVTERRIALCLDEACQCVVIAPRVTSMIDRWAKDQRITWHTTVFGDEHIELLKQSTLVFISTDDRAVNDHIETLARTYKVLLNRSDAPESCDFTIPSTLDIGDIHVAIGANNGSPRINRLIREDMSKRYSELKIAMPRLKIIRDEVKLLVPNIQDRQQFWRTHLDTITFEAILNGEWPLIEEKLHHAISGIRSKS